MTGKITGVWGDLRWPNNPPKSIKRRVVEGLWSIVWPPYPVYRYSKPKRKFVKVWRRSVYTKEWVLVWEPER